MQIGFFKNCSTIIFSIMSSITKIPIINFVFIRRKFIFLEINLKKLSIHFKILI